MSDTQEQDDLRENAETKTQAQPKTELPGRRLRETREEKHLTREEVARHLHLDVQLIIALEQDDYSHLPSSIYIRGYLSSYARLLKLPEKEIVEAYSHGEQINPELIPDIVKVTTQKQVVNPAVVKFIIILIVLALLGVGAYYLVDVYKIFSRKITDASQGNSQSSELAIPSDSSTVTKAIQTSPPAEPAQSANKDTKSTPEPVKPSPPPVPPAKMKTGKETIEKLPTPKSTIPASEPVSSASSSQDAANATDKKTAPTNSAGSATPASTAMLEMRFSDDSWVEVTDSTNNQLVYRLVEKGTDLKLTGVPPFKILLGNAAAVQVFYNGKEFAHKNYHPDQVGSFMVGDK